MTQFVPDVSGNDIIRVIKRDFPSETHAEIFKIIQGLDVQEKSRVVLACIKNSKGGIEKLKRQLMDASGYYREIIGEAENPHYMRKCFHTDKLPPAEVAGIIEKDKKQYLEWLQADMKATSQP
jgi:hypothetical protein